ncbi:MAG: hypothetical protein WC969_00805 [Elusimicrobiota bacterium]|jgi:hypothetical protein
MILALLLAASAWSTKPDVLAPGFWTRPYSFPPSYCHHRITLTTDDLRTIGQAARPCGFVPADPAGDSLYAYCRTSISEIDKILQKLERRGKIVTREISCTDPPANEELYFKRDVLRQESATIEKSSSSFPGIRGLLDAELWTLDKFIAAREMAAQPLLEIVAAHPAAGRAVSTQELWGRRPAHPVAQAEQDRDPSWLKPWARTTYPACLQAPRLFVEYTAAPGSEAERKILTRLLRLGERYEEPACDSLSPNKRSTAIVTMLPQKDLQRILTSLPGLRAWTEIPRIRYAGSVTDDERVEVLSRELSSAESLRRDVPHVVALTQAEIERLQPTAGLLSRIRKGRFVAVGFRAD